MIGHSWGSHLGRPSNFLGQMHVPQTKKGLKTAVLDNQIYKILRIPSRLLIKLVLTVIWQHRNRSENNFIVMGLDWIV